MDPLAQESGGKMWKNCADSPETSIGAGVLLGLRKSVSTVSRRETRNAETLRSRRAAVLSHNKPDLQRTFRGHRTKRALYTAHACCRGDCLPIQRQQHSLHVIVTPSFSLRPRFTIHRLRPSASGEARLHGKRAQDADRSGNGT